MVEVQHSVCHLQWHGLVGVDAARDLAHDDPLLVETLGEVGEGLDLGERHAAGPRRAAGAQFNRQNCLEIIFKFVLRLHFDTVTGVNY